MLASIKDSVVATQAISSVSVSALKGVGPQTKEKLGACGIQSVLDVLMQMPIRYEDRTRVSTINHLSTDQSIHVVGVVESANVVFAKRRQLICRVSDGTGSLILRFFHFNGSQKQALSVEGTPIRVFGLVRQGRSGLEMVHPSYELGAQALQPLPAARVYTPVYRALGGLSVSFWQKLIATACALLKQPTVQLTDDIPARLRGRMRLPTLSESLLFVHAPPIEVAETVLLERTHPMFKRLALEELLAHQFSLADGQTIDQGVAPIFDSSFQDKASLGAKLIESLPFLLTGAQQRAIKDIEQDCAKSAPMMRLIQGDVGSGKTLVAALAVCQAISAGYQAAIMAPTEILVAQHIQNFKRWLTPLGITVGSLLGSMKAKEKEEMRSSIALGDAQLVIGTHALFQSTVKFKTLGLLVIDEQHRFGVSQRLALRDKADNDLAPHQLVMTATPIPRSLAMTAYAHCDHSIIDELPPGRQPIKTAVMSQSKREQVVARLESQLSDGARAYWVCPLIEESESLNLQNIDEHFDYLKQALPNWSIAQLHGRMTSVEKDTVMRAFIAGDTQVLVSTTVIEVGVDVPDATVMIIENAERFGLAQLHQLRGRVGRGAAASHCILMVGDRLSDGARSRIQAMRTCVDGFELAEWDLKLRGPGELLGAKQAGFFEFQIADWKRDSDLLPLLKTIREEIEKNEALSAVWQEKQSGAVSSKWLKG